MREEIAPYDDVLARFRGARLYAHGEDGVAYLAEHGGLPYLLVRPGPEEPDMIVLAFEDELERAVYLAGRDTPEGPASPPSKAAEDAPAIPRARSAAAPSPGPLPVRGS
ncbi:hypothetical protein [Actinomadura rubrisoli]|uniref:Uncharacterized protein n=1 Tax=Actinomadura rubrisoli TaxID=2530368 RepID=A0A4R5AGF4_9ACTN|nr:hypothetical protein [Actinomadura rubrisoli]TDD71491.1 hypothetical protein E1298_35745 [Actinomadura rubrisoli]